MNKYVNNMRTGCLLYFLLTKRKYFHYILLEKFCVIKKNDDFAGIWLGF